MVNSVKKIPAKGPTMPAKHAGTHPKTSGMPPNQYSQSPKKDAEKGTSLMWVLNHFFFQLT